MPKERSSSSSRLGTNEFRRVADWTKRELSNLQKTSDVPVCIELATGDYLVGTYTVKKISSVCWRVDPLEFCSKRSAIFYSALTHMGKIAEATKIHDLDFQVGRLEYERTMFRERLDAAHLALDQFKIDLYGSRFDETKRLLMVAKRDLENIFSKAKYHYGIF